MSRPEDAALGANTIDEVVELERIYQRRVADQLMDQGVRLADPSRLDVRGSLTTEPGGFIDAGVLLEGEVKLGRDVHIGPGVTIKNTSLGEGVRIEANTVIEGSPDWTRMSHRAVCAFATEDAAWARKCT